MVVSYFTGCDCSHDRRVRILFNDRRDTIKKKLNWVNLRVGFQLLLAKLNKAKNTWLIAAFT